MPAQPQSEDTLRAAADAVEAIAEYGSYRRAAAALGIPASTLQGRIARVRKSALTGECGGPPIPESARPPEGFVINRNAGEYDAKGNLRKQWVGTVRDAGEAFEIPAGHVVKGESALLDPQGRVLAKWIKTREGAGAGLVDGLRAAFAEYAGAAPVVPAPTVSDDDLLTVYPIPDLHLGMRAWKAEAGSNYDVKIAARIAREAISVLVGQSRPSSNAVVLIAGDFYHQNDNKNVTPGSGHQLDTDGRWPSVYLAGANLAIQIIDEVAKKHSNVEVVAIPGNHDPDASVTLSVALSLFYSKTPRIAVNLTPGVTWYRRFHSNLLGANHGHTMRTAERMAMAMAVDCAEDWGKTQHRQIFTGHLHHEIAREVAGVRVETLTSPAAKDAWNSASGYRSSRALSAITFHSKNGEIGRHRVSIGVGGAAIAA